MTIIAKVDGEIIGRLIFILTHVGSKIATNIDTKAIKAVSAKNKRMNTIIDFC